MSDYHVLNLGPGVQSTALYLLAREGRVRFDWAIFADTGEEPAAVYRHLEHLRTLGGPPILVRSAGRLGDDLVHGRNSTGQRFVSIPAFTRAPDGRIGMVRRQCTAEYKVEVVNRAIRRELLGLKPRQRIPRDVTVYQYFGISIDEAGRAARAQKRFAEVKHTVPVYPLIELGWSRTDCVGYLRQKLPYEVPKSSCVFCPYRTNLSWLHLKQTDPEGWRRAVEIDEALRADGTIATRGFRQQLYLHRTCQPLAGIDWTALVPTTLDPMTTGECLGRCGT
ncbi:hypothetical protein [Fimbriiglobus ruber]|uniref:Phosphoadenosine phosphosulfate reductase n=1 Tax=Fimbriiglobus ruber TaxID=1908690 RepID=A0A225E7T2_9BACT|nr:hypothetical protein [Fimbriiglobus ruber]OWK45569.1 hypothetical protein FRUB_01900 [Fimbriiglobus ruber]